MTDNPRDLVMPWLLGELAGAEAQAFERLMASDPDLAEEVRATGEALAAMALATPVAPRPELKTRVLAAAAASKGAVLPPIATRRSGAAVWLGIGLAASLILAAVTSLEWRSTAADRDQLLASRDSALGAIAVRDSLLARFTDPELESVRLVADPAKDPTIRMMLDAKRGRLTLSAAELPQLGANQDYQLWYIIGGNAVPSVVFHPDAAGSALALDVPMPDRGTITAVAVTIEPTGGSPAPTSTPRFVTPLGE
ncbi:MAG TPA: anti-sigma factor [Gemmatimonadales bacterium]|nr:anti-sigma factor [Gemmatimonadales bacterium]